MSTCRGCPPWGPDLADGISGATMAHCSSVRSEGYFLRDWSFCNIRAHSSADGICANYLTNILLGQALFPDSLLLYIEEAGRTGIPNLPDHVSTLRSRKIPISADFQDRSQGYALYGKDRAINMFNNFRYQIYFRQDDLETAQFLEMRCGSKSGFAHSKTAHE